jgi:hypothetical protein
MRQALAFTEYEEITKSLREVERLQANQASKRAGDLVVRPNIIGAHVAAVGGALLTVLLLLPPYCVFCLIG